MLHRFAVGAVTCATFIVAPGVAQQSSTDNANPLAGFERLIGGRWDAGDSRHVFEWGVGRQVVRSRSYFVTDGRERLVSEGMWYWHPEDCVIRGTVVAVEMPVFLFEMETRFVGDTLVSELVTYGEQGGKYREQWVFSGDTTYEWTLFNTANAGAQAVMRGKYHRIPEE